VLASSAFCWRHASSVHNITLILSPCRSPHSLVPPSPLPLPRPPRLLPLPRSSHATQVAVTATPKPLDPVHRGKEPAIGQGVQVRRCRLLTPCCLRSPIRQATATTLRGHHSRRGLQEPRARPSLAQGRRETAADEDEISPFLRGARSPGDCRRRDEISHFLCGARSLPASATTAAADSNSATNRARMPPASTVAGGAPPRRYTPVLRGSLSVGAADDRWFCYQGPASLLSDIRRRWYIERCRLCYPHT
jgi:hypothetical protein